MFCILTLNNLFQVTGEFFELIRGSDTVAPLRKVSCNDEDGCFTYKTYFIVWSEPN